MDTKVLEVHTGSRAGVFDLTAEVRSFLIGKPDGLVSVFVPHATAGVALIETGAGSDGDLMETIERLLPRDDGLYSHRHGAPGHGGDHVLPAFIGPSITIPLVGGRLALGTWQSVVLVDPNRDNTVRQVRLSFVPG